MRVNGLIFYYLLIVISNSCKNKVSSNNTENEKPSYKISSLVDSNYQPANENLKDHNALPIIADTAKVNELKKFVTIKKDEYKERYWYKPKTAPIYRNQNGIYCYFSTDTLSSIGYLRLVFQYYADDWLFINNYRFVIDGKAYSFTPTNIERDNGYGGIWEWSDDLIHKDDKAFIEALANAKSAKVKIEGTRYYKEKTLTSQQLKSINIIYELHKAMGGKLLD